MYWIISTETEYEQSYVHLQYNMYQIWGTSFLSVSDSESLKKEVFTS